MATKPIVKTYGLFIDGEERPSASGKKFAVLSPSTGETIGYAARANAADADAAVGSAWRAFGIWSSMAPADRERAMLKAADVVEANTQLLIELLIDESGSTIQKARFEVNYTASLLRTAAGEVRRLYGDTFPNDKPHRMSIVVREPLGVIVAISPFNAPLVLLAKMVVFPLAAGNAVIAKPSEETPLIALEFAKLLIEAGIPAGTVNVLTGYGAEVGEPLVKHEHVKGIALTGSTGTGIKVASLAVNTMKRMQLELGGKNPLLVLNDADPDEAAEIAAVGAYYHAGQICMSSSRIIVEKRIAKAFAKALSKKASSLYLGELRDERTAYGPLINQKALDKVKRHVDDALSGGAKLMAGGGVHSGFTYKPTVLFNPPRNNTSWSEETFGPVASIIEAEDLEEAITIANDSEYGLSAGILTNDLKRGMQAAKMIHCGAVHIGMHSFQSDSLAPVGGFGLSGVGRSGGKYSIEHFTELKWISMELGETSRPF